MSKEKEPFVVWESKHSTPKVTVQMPTADAVEAIQRISTKVEDDFISAMMQATGDTLTIRTSGFSFDTAHSISLKIEDARELAKWILEHSG